MGQLVKTSGLQSDFLNGEKVISCPWYDSLGGFIRGTETNLFAANPPQGRGSRPGRGRPPAFKRRLKKKTPTMQAAITKCIARLAENPRHPGLNTHKIRGTDGIWEAYVDKGNRVTFHYDDDGGIVMRHNCNHDIIRREARTGR